MKLLGRDLSTQMQLLSQRRAMRHLSLGYGLDRIAVWMLSVALSITVYQDTGSIAAVALLLLVYVVARIWVAWYSPFGVAPKRATVLTAIAARFVATASLFVYGVGELLWVLLSLAVVAGATGALEKSFHRALPRHADIGQLPTVNGLVRSVEQVCAVLGPLLAGVILLMLHDGVVMGVVTALLLVSAVSGTRWLDLVHDDSKHQRLVLGFSRSLLEQLRPYAKLRIVVSGLLCVAAIGVLIRVALVDVALNRLEFAAGYYGVLIALVGFGAFFGPAPVDKLLGHLSVESIFAGGVLALAVGAVVALTVGHVILIAPVLLGTGMLIITLDVVASVALRRLVPVDDLPVIDEVLLRAVFVGQIVSLSAVLVLSSVWSVSVAVVVVSAAAGTVIAALFLTGGRSVAAWQMISTPGAKRETPRDVQS